VNTTCFAGNDGSATVVAAGGTGTYTYSWAPTSGTTATLNNLASGPYTVTVTDGNGCVATQSFFIAQPVAPPIVANASANPICTGGTLTLFGTGGVTYTWNNSVINNVPFTINATTTYIVTGTDANGCSLNDTITINVNPLPTLTATAADGAICPGASDVLTASGASSYVWSSGGTAATETVTPVATSTYTVTGTDVNGCVNTTTVQVVVNALPNVVATASATAVCIGDTTTLSATGADTYVWQPMNTAGSSVAVAPSVASTYVVEGTDLEGCVNTDTITINVNALPVVNLGNDTTVCGSILLDAGNAGSTYLWNDNSTSSTLLVNNNGSYHVAVTDANGCTNNDTITVAINSLPLVTLDLSSIDTVCSNSVTLINLVGETPIGGTWSGAGVVNGNQFDATLANSPAWNVIIYSFTDSVGCTASAADSIFVDVCSGIADNANTASMNISVYPNPTSGIFIIEGTTANDVIVVMNAVGQVVVNETANGNRTEINLSTYANGVYFVRVVHGTEMKTQRVMLSR
jgi:hypothetical protein